LRMHASSARLIDLELMMRAEDSNNPPLLRG